MSWTPNSARNIKKWWANRSNWIRAKCSKAGDAANAYAAEVVDANFEKPGDDDMLGKVKADLQKAGVSVSNAEVSKALTDAYAAAAQQIRLLLK